MKHKHYEMIVAKAANMDLVVFMNGASSDWIEATIDELVTLENRPFFLCLPQHKEACLHWLSGGESQYLSNGVEEWVNFGNSTRWSGTHLFMTTECEIRIKPKKEKRLIAVNGDSVCFVNPDLACPAHCQFIEIEVEV